jgi:putative SOS response-associated peptidase YedK
MCGRYFGRSDKQRTAEAFKLGRLPEHFVLPDWDYNVAPTTSQPSDTQTAERELVLMRWGLVPHLAKSLADFKGSTTINATAESLVKSAMWKFPSSVVAVSSLLMGSMNGKRSMPRPTAVCIQHG